MKLITHQMLSEMLQVLSDGVGQWEVGGQCRVWAEQLDLVTGHSAGVHWVEEAVFIALCGTILPSLTGRHAPPNSSTASCLYSPPGHQNTVSTRLTSTSRGRQGRWCGAAWLAWQCRGRSLGICDASVVSSDHVIISWQLLQLVWLQMGMCQNFQRKKSF